MTQTTAVVLMDIQQGIVEGYVPPDSTILERARTARQVARDLGHLNVLVRVGFRDNYPDVSSGNKIFSGAAQHGLMRDDSESTRLHASLDISADDVIVTKRRVGAFHGTDLDLILRSQGISRLIVGGIATSGVVLSTVRAAADLDYEIYVLEDCCVDPVESVHQALMEHVFPVQAEVVTSQWYAEHAGSIDG
jgi:nicotinamidase-related amidase